MPDFTAVIEGEVIFVATELDEGVDFTDSGDSGQIIVPGLGYGEGGYGEGGYGGDATIVVINGNVPTIWTNIDTP